jgi:hypothetical protein
LRLSTSSVEKENRFIVFPMFSNGESKLSYLSHNSAFSSVLPTNFTNFLPDQPKNSAAGEKVRPPHKLDSQRPNLQFFKWFMIQNGKETISKPAYFLAGNIDDFMKNQT